MGKLRSLAVGIIAAVVGFTLAVAPASADPQAVEEARIELERIQQEASALDQEIIEAAVRAQEAEAKLEQINEDLTKQRDKVSGLGEILGQLAVAQFQSGGFDLTTRLLTSTSDDDFLSSLATIQNETDRGNADIQAFQLEQARLDQLQTAADQTHTSMQADLEAKEELAKDYENKEAEAEAVYERLEAEERERLRQIELERQRQQAEADRRAAERAAQQAAAASRSTSNSNSNNSNSNSNAGSQSSNSSSAAATTQAEAAPSGGSGSARGQQAVNAALGKVGSRYVWGSSGPNSFDCSGLTSWAYRQVGINLPRSSRAQAGLGQHVSKSDLRPGDLVFYYSPVSHVAIYVGNGRIVDAANPRSGVRTASLNSMPYNTARRVA